jgi:Autographiviridae RNA polymerase
VDLARTITRAQKEEWRILKAYGYGYTAEGTALVERCFNKLAAYIKEALRRQPRSHSLAEPLWLVLKELDADKLAVAVLTAFVHSVWLRDPEERSPSLKSQLSIGHSIRRECLHHELLQSDRELLKKATKAAKRYPDVRRREREIERMLTAAGFRVSEWSEHQLVEAGNWGMESVVAALPTVYTLDKKGAPVIFEDAVESASAISQQLLLRDPIYSPRRLPPQPWTSWENEDGATLVRNARSVSAIKTALRKGTMTQHVDGVNRLQSVPWIINTRVLDVLNALDPSDPVLKLKGRSGRGIGGEELFKNDIEIARQLTGARFWTPYNLDWRGRAYTLSDFGFWREDRVRSLFLFANGLPIGTRGIYWLKLHVANTGDFDKISKRSLDERVQWTDANISKIELVATDPVRNTWWRETDQPFQFLAACCELETALRVGPTHVTRLPIGFDGSANGVQHMAAMMRAENEGALVNLTPQSEPTDLYEIIAQNLNERLESLEGAHDKYVRLCHSWGVDRKLTKKPTMTFPYSATPVGMRKQITEILEERGFPVEFKAAHWLAGQINSTVIGVLKGPSKAMEFLKGCADLMAKQNKAVTWTTPTGFPLCNRYQKSRTKRIRLWLHDRPIRRVLADGFKPKILKRKVKNGISPNITHAVDSSHLMMTVNAAVTAGIGSVAAIHDCYCCLAPQADSFRRIIREQFVRLHRENDILAQVRDAVVRDLGMQNSKEIPTIPQRGTLDLRGILAAEYAFS